MSTDAPERADGRPGRPLAPGVRARLERALGADLGAVRVYSDERAHRVTALVGADAVTAGTSIHLSRDCPEPTTEPGLRLLAHEAAHVVQQARMRPARWLEARSADAWSPAALEAAADSAAERAVRGLAAPVGSERITPLPAAPGGPVLVQRHASWEHRLLGDASTADLVAVAMRAASRPQVLTRIRDFLGMWRDDPDSVTPQMITARYPSIRTLTLPTSGLLVTYGELNTLPDYLANPTVLDAQPRSIMLPILQAVRQEGYNWVNWLLGNLVPTSFRYAVSIPTNNAFIDLIAETKALDSLTVGVGPSGTNHYTAVVARNACHFAPYSWYRWEQYHLIARDLATQAHAATDPARRARLTSMAWRNHGYADHFLQDSFAAGHLVNKNLIMQWFVEWAASKWYVPVPDWDRVKYLTTARQPGLAAYALYNAANPGSVRDPQTAEEQATAAARTAMAGVQADGSMSQATAYANYLAFLNSTVVQSASGVLHDYFNAQSLWVGSTAHPAAYQIWGDDTLLNGGDGVGIASQTAHMSQQALLDLLSSGTTSITTQAIRDCFPSTVRVGGGAQASLQSWNQGLRSQAFDLFPDVHYFALRAEPYIGSVSIDVVGGSSWQQVTGSAAAIAAGADGSVWALGSAAVPGGHPVYSWNGSGWTPHTGGAVRIAVAPDGTPWVVNDAGTIYRMVSEGNWQALPGAASDIGAGADGSVWILGTGTVAGGHPVFSWNGSGWTPHSGGGVRIAVGPDGLPWLVNDAGSIYRGDGQGGWTTLPGSGTAIAVGQNSAGTPWLLTTTQVAGGRTVATLAAGSWVPVDGGAVEVAVDAAGLPWLVNDTGAVYRRVLGTAVAPRAAAVTGVVPGPRAEAAVAAPAVAGQALSAPATLHPPVADDSARRVPAVPPSAGAQR